jgi:ribosomal protein S24E
MTSEFTPTPGWLAEETEPLRPRIAEMLAERQRAAALDAIDTEFGGHAASMAVAIYELRRRLT